MLHTVRLRGKKRTIAEAARELSIDAKELDSDYGVVTVDPRKGVYAVRTRDDAAKTPKGGFADPVIAPMGPVRRR
jgi:hypothetical protein